MEEMEEEEIETTINCSNTDISITAEDNIVVNHATNPVRWEGTYTDTTVKIHYTIPAGVNEETETFVFVFNKIDSCLKIERGFKFYNGGEDDISALTEMNVTEFYTKEWETNKKFTGNVVYTDPHDKQVYSKKFWLEFTENNKEIVQTEFKTFESCFGNTFPLDIDMNNDGIVDYQLGFEETRDIGNTPKYNRYTIKLISTNEAENQILSPRKTQGPYSVLFQAPFTSENTRQYFNEVKSSLDVFYEFDEPYSSYNYFLSNNLTYKSFFENDRDDYYIIKMGLNNQDYYGWIKFNFDSTTCTAEILDTFLSTQADTDISIK
jgi:hypothetical protein